MVIADFVRNKEVKKFIEEVFGEDKHYTVTGTDVVKEREHIASKGNLKFSICYNNLDELGIEDDDNSGELPEIFSQPSYCVELRNKFAEINEVKVKYWSIKFGVEKSKPEPDSEKFGSYITLDFDVRFE